jgi:hypothetical protein
MDETQIIAFLKQRFEDIGPTAQIPLIKGDYFTAKLSMDGILVDNLGSQPLLPWIVFQEAIRILVFNGGRALRGDAMNNKLGEDGLPENSIEGHIAKVVYNKHVGDTVFRRITPIVCILIWAGVCTAEPSELVLIKKSAHS